MPQSAPQGDWTVQTADSIERVVVAIRDKTTIPLTTVARAIVFGQIVLIVGVTALVLLAVAAVRVLDIVTGAGNVWIAHLAVGGIFTLIGLFLMRKATAGKR